MQEKLTLAQVLEVIADPLTCPSALAEICWQVIVQGEYSEHRCDIFLALVKSPKTPGAALRMIYEEDDPQFRAAIRWDPMKQQ